ncbi:MAG TPA: leucine-rich repeat protein [Clostridiales bacterium]|nr:leucine-rich repeat protein [Clostridiales bacterium]
MKKLLSVLMVLAMFITALPFALTVTAETEGYLTYEVTDGTVTITDCDESVSGKIEIPKTLSGNFVTTIGGGAFDNCTDLIEIIIPDSVTTICQFAFFGCSELTEIIIPDSVTIIEDSAFESCSRLEKITIPDSVTRIGAFVFFATPYYENELNRTADGLLYNGKHLLAADSNKLPHTYTIKDGTKTIAGSAFIECTDLTGITIPDSVVSIGPEAFGDCKGLTDIEISASVAFIGSSAFRSCPALEYIKVDKDNENYYSSGNCLIEKGTNRLIAGCKNSVIPNSVTKIEEFAFADCRGLTEITIPKSVTEIAEFAFIGCSGLESVTVDENNTKYHSSGNCIIEKGTATLILGCKNSIIPNFTKIIDVRAFEGCTGLTEISIPESVTEIRTGAFGGCSGLGSIDVDKNNAKYYSSGNCLIEKETNLLILGCKNSAIPNSVTMIADDAFKGCTGLTEITIPDSVTKIGVAAFYDCTGLTEISIPDSVTVIDMLTFLRCTGLTKITIPDSVTEIGHRAFMDCTGLTEITIPDAVTHIGESAFSGCTGLTEIVIPASVTIIFNEAFNGCTGLTDVYYTGTEDEWIHRNLYDFGSTVTMHYNFIPAEKPTEIPTEKPTEAPTEKPTEKPTEAPTEKPTEAKILDYNKLPVKVKIIGEYLNIAKELTVGQVKEALNEFIVKIIDADKNQLGNENAIGTGCLIEIYDGDNFIEKKTVVFKGDINGDGKIKTTDARNALRGALGLDNLSDAQILAADVNNDGKLKATDARAILRGAMGLDETETWLG